MENQKKYEHLLRDAAVFVEDEFRHLDKFVDKKHTAKGKADFQLNSKAFLKDRVDTVVSDNEYLKAFLKDLRPKVEKLGRVGTRDSLVKLKEFIVNCPEDLQDYRL